jgi:hypothetical protein
MEKSTLISFALAVAAVWVADLINDSFQITSRLAGLIGR